MKQMISGRGGAGDETTALNVSAMAKWITWFQAKEKPGDQLPAEERWHTRF